MQNTQQVLDSETRVNPPCDDDRRHFLKLAATLVASIGIAEVSESCQKALPLPPSTPPATTPPVTTPPPTNTPALTPTPSPSPAPTPPPSPPTVSESLRARLARLLRRAGFGASKAELDRFESIGLNDTVDQLLDYDKLNEADLAARLDSLKLDLSKAPDLQRWWLIRLLYTQRPLQEKMVLFWHGLLTSGLSRVGGQVDFMLAQNQLFRQQAMGAFPDLLKAVSRDPAMLMWLDSRSNKKSAPNENFARELMELFTMGVGNYTEQDVRESARAFTGWFLKGGNFFFDASQHDNGIKKFLGESGAFLGDDIVDIIVKQPVTADFICRKLFVFFAYEPADAATVSKMSLAFRTNGYSIKAAMRELLTSESFLAADESRTRIKSPSEFVVAILRSLEVPSDGSGLIALMTRMGQTLFDPPNVAGWPPEAWINSSTLLERINFANQIITNRQTFNSKAGSSAEQLVDYYYDLLLDGKIAPQVREQLHEHARSLFKVGSADAAARAVVYLILSSPYYHLA